MASRRPRWRVAVVDDHAASRAVVSVTVARAGGIVVGETPSALAARDVIAAERPDVAIFAIGLEDGDGLSAAQAVMDSTPCPIVMLSRRQNADLIDRARRAGVMAYLLKPLRPEELPPALDLAIARFAEIQELRRRLASRKVIERAKGLLMARQGITEDEAFRALRSTAMNQRKPMAEIAEALVVAESLAAPASR